MEGKGQRVRGQVKGVSRSNELGQVAEDPFQGILRERLKSKFYSGSLEAVDQGFRDGGGVGQCRGKADAGTRMSRYGLGALEDCGSWVSETEHSALACLDMGPRAKEKG